MFTNGQQYLESIAGLILRHRHDISVTLFIKIFDIHNMAGRISPSLSENTLSHPAFPAKTPQAFEPTRGDLPARNCQ